MSFILPKKSLILNPLPAGFTFSSFPFLESKNAFSTSRPIPIAVPIPGNIVAIPDATSIKPPTTSPDLNLETANAQDIIEPIPGILLSTGFKSLNSIPPTFLNIPPIAPPLKSLKGFSNAPLILLNTDLTFVLTVPIILPIKPGSISLAPSPFKGLSNLAPSPFNGLSSILPSPLNGLSNLAPSPFNGLSSILPSPLNTLVIVLPTPANFDANHFIPPPIPTFANILSSPFAGPSDIIPVTKAANPPSINNAGPISFFNQPSPPSCFCVAIAFEGVAIGNLTLASALLSLAASSLGSSIFLKICATLVYRAASFDDRVLSTLRSFFKSLPASSCLTAPLRDDLSVLTPLSPF